MKFAIPAFVLALGILVSSTLSFAKPEYTKKEKKGYKKWKTIKTDKKGKYKVRLPRRGGTWYWSFTVKGDSKYLANGFGWRTWVS